MLVLPRPYAVRQIEHDAAALSGRHRSAAPQHVAGVNRQNTGNRFEQGGLPGALSKGYGRRLIWALALLAPHPLLLMDEPFDGFDLRQTREMISVLRRIVGRGRTLILSIHQLPDAERACDRFVLLAGGRVCGIGTLDELRAHSKRPGAPLEEVFLALT